MDNTLSPLYYTLPLPQSLEPCWGAVGGSLCERLKEHSKSTSLGWGYGALALCSFHHVGKLVHYTQLLRSPGVV